VTALIVIPARYASSRYPGKPLARETGKFLIQHVVEQARKVRLASQVVVATDDRRIVEAVESFGGTAVMTAETHPSGTDRIAEVVRRAEYRGVEIVVNVQGDEPEVEPELVNGLIAVLRDRPGTQMATAAAGFEKAEDVGNSNMVKVVVDREGHALYFSRSVIPYDRDGEMARAGGATQPYLKHLGLYAYRREALLALADASPCALERLEKLEQLRALYLGMKIHVTETSHAAHGIDTPADYAAFLRRYNGSLAQVISSE
jgi:3-deoxy-manno-octulosonate cytidylyltransferase (CMP-KDO synthetase)